jgi:phospholipase/lecithinase/hemolysin
MASRPFLARTLLTLLSLLSIPCVAGPYTGLYVLGDSLSDQGNLLAATSILGTALHQPAQPETGHYFQGRFSNGFVYTDYLAQRLGVALSPSLLDGTNFAFGGARTDYNTVEVPPFGNQVYPRGAYPWSLNAEREAFESRTAANGGDPRALYVVFSGSNDVTDILARRLPPASTIANAVAAIRQVIETFKAAGAETVLVPNLPDLGVVPRITQLESGAPGISAKATQLTQAFNAALEDMLSSEADVRIVRFDTFDFLRDVVENPQRYGFTNSTEACYSGFVLPNPAARVCPDPGDRVFWDVEHPTTAFHELLAAQILLAIAPVPEPRDLLLFGSGLTALALAQRRNKSNIRGSAEMRKPRCSSDAYSRWPHNLDRRAILLPGIAIGEGALSAPAAWLQGRTACCSRCRHPAHIIRDAAI